MAKAKMLTIEDFEIGQAYMVLTECKRAAKVLSAETIRVEVIVDPNQPPVMQSRKTVTVLICNPAKPVPGHITGAEADENLIHRLRGKDLFSYDMWHETWIETPRERIILEGRQRQIEKDWMWVVTVHDVKGRAEVHEAYKSPHKLGRTQGKLDSGTTIEAVLILPENVHPQLFNELGEDEKTQSELDRIAHDKAVIDAHEVRKAAEKKEARRGDPAECRDWGGASVLKMHMDICGLEKPDKDSGHFNDTSRAMLKTYLNGIGIDPWDVMDLGRPEFQEAVDNARQAMVV